MKSKFTRILGVGIAIAFLSSFLMVAPVAADVSEPAVDVDDEEISAISEYDITFEVNDEVENTVNGTISIRFPEDTVIADNFSDGDVTIQSTAGFGSPNDGTDTINGDNVTVEEDDDIYTVTIALDQLGDPIGEGAMVRVTFTIEGGQITNPTEPGEYTLEVQTSEEDDWVESADYEIEVPDIEVPGAVKRYNPADILMEIYTGDGNIQDAINASGDEDTLVLGDGTYTEAAINVPVGLDELTIEASGTAEETIIEGVLTIEGDELTLSGLTIEGVVVDGAEDVIIENCVFAEEEATQLTATGAIDLTVEGCTFDVTDDSEVGIDVDLDSDATIEDCTFDVEDGTTAIDTDNETAVEACTFTGSSGIGVLVAVATSDVTIEDSTFDTLEAALDINNGAVTLDGNTIQASEEEAINIADCTEVLIVNNILQDNEDDAIVVADTANASLIQVMFNSFSGNEVDIDTNADQDLNIANNWWGTADGPDSDLIEGDVIDEPWLGSAAANGEIDTNSDSLDAEDTAGVVVSSDVAVDIISVASYAANPQADTPDPASSFFDVYVSDPGAAAAEINIRLYGDVTDETVAYMWGEVQGDWVEASDQGVSLFGGYVWIAVEDEDTVPTIEDLSGTVFALIESEVDEELEVEILGPELGEDDISLTPTLTWTAVEDAIGYEIAVAEDDTFAILDYSATSTLNGHVVKEELKLTTTYYWRVRAVTGPAAPKQPAPGGPWETGLFTTMAEAVPEEPPIIVEQITPAAPVIKVEPKISIPAEKVTKVTIPSPVKPIDPTLLWVIVGIGAVLVIALIVLIVRTRRVA